jgi:transposase
MLEGKVDHVIGVDTHRDAHAAAILDRNGGLLAQLEVPSSQAGYEELLGLVVQRARGRRCWGLEGTGCYGAGLASFLADHGEWVTEIDRPKRTGRTQAKSDPLDAIRAGREALSREHLATPRQRGQREALRVLQLTRAGAVKVAADARRHLKALLMTAPEPLRAGLRGQTWLRQARACAALTAQPGDPVEYRATVRALRTTAERALAAHQEATQLGKELGTLARVVAPALLAQPGVGPVTAAQVLISWSHPGRLRSEAAFAMLAGVASPGSCTGCLSGRPCPPPVQEGSYRRRCRRSMAEPAERPDGTTDTPGAGERPEAAWVGGGGRVGCRPGPHRSPAGEPSPPGRRRPADPDQPGVPDQLPAGRRPGGICHPLPWAAAHLAAG